jgi:hypothetical protein
LPAVVPAPRFQEVTPRLRNFRIRLDQGAIGGGGRAQQQLEAVDIDRPYRAAGNERNR